MDAHWNLVAAARDGDLERVVELLDAGANVNCTDYEGKTPLTFAASRGHAAVVEMLLNGGANADHIDKTQRSPLTYASSQGRVAVVEMLLRARARVDCCDRLGKTPLMQAAYRNHVGVVEMLLNGGATADCADSDGMSALMHAATQGRERVIEKLIDAGANVNLQDTVGKTAVMHALVCDQLHVVMQLLGAGANGDIGDEYGKTALMYGVSKGADEVVRTFLRMGANVQLVDQSGKTALIHAAIEGHVNIVEILLKAGADVECADNDKATALMHAASQGHIGVVEKLIAAGAELESTKTGAQTPLMCASSYGHTNVVGKLLAAGAQVDPEECSEKTPLIVASLNNYVGVVRTLLSVGAKVNRTTSRGQTALMYAASDAVVEVLVTAGAQVDSVDKEGKTALTHASSENLEHVAKALLEAGADVNHRDAERRTPLIVASTNGQASVVKLLLEAGADPNDSDIVGQTPLMYAALSGHMQAVDRLLDADANPNGADHAGKTPLMFASSKAHEPIVARLLSARANANAADNEGKTSLMYASSEGHVSIVQHLLSAGALVDSATSAGETALMYASTGGGVRAVSKLLASGAEVNRPNAVGRTALMYAVTENHFFAVEKLLAAGAQVNNADMEGQTPLMLASTGGYSTVTETLLAASAAVDCTDTKGKTAAMYAATEGHARTLEKLLAAGTNANHIDAEGKTTLIHASLKLSQKAVTGNHDVVKMLLRLGTDIHHIDSAGRTALMYASLSGMTEVVQTLISAGAKVDDGDKNGNRTALTYASSGSHVGVVDKLLAANAQVDHVDNDGMTPLMHAAHGLQQDFVATLLEAEAEGKGCEQIELVTAAVKRNVGVVRKLLAAGASVHSANISGMTPLLYASCRRVDEAMMKMASDATDVMTRIEGERLIKAAAQSSADVVEALLQAGAKIDSSDQHRRTPLMYASIGNQGVEMIPRHWTETDFDRSLEASLSEDTRVSKLLAAGAKVDIADKEGKTALMLAALHGNSRIVDRLLASGASANLTDFDGLTTLMHASSGGWVDTVETLIKANAEVNVSDMEGKTALIAAASRGCTQVVNKLIASKANSDWADRYGMTPLMYASASGHVHVVESLLKTGARVSGTNNAGYTPLMLAAKEGHEFVVELLVEFMKHNIAMLKNDVNAFNAQGESALVLASKLGHLSVVRVLISHGARITRSLLSDETPVTCAASPELRDFLSDCQKCQQYHDQCLALMKDTSSISVQRLSRLVPLITSVFDVSAMLTLLTLCEDPIVGNSPVESMFDHVVDHRLMFDKNARRFFEAAVQYCKSAEYVSEAKLEALLPASPAGSTRCRGFSVTTNQRCRISEDLNDDGFCKTHDPDAIQCRGLTQTGRRCRIKEELNSEQFCIHHTDQVEHPKFPLDDSKLRERLREIEAITRLEVVKIATEAHTLVMNCRANVEVLSRRLRSLQSEVTVGCKLYECVKFRMPATLSPMIEVRLAKAKDVLEERVFGFNTFHGEREENSKLLRGVTSAIASFVFPPKVVNVKNPIVDFSDPIEIITELYQEEDVALFLADQSTKDLYPLLRSQLEDHAISHVVFETLLREAVAALHPEYLDECVRRKLPVNVVCCKSGLTPKMLFELEQVETDVTAILSDLLEALDSTWFPSSVQFNDAIRSNNGGRSRFGSGGFRGILRSLRSRRPPRVSSSGSSFDSADSSENAVATYISDVIDSTKEGEIVRYSKICVLGSSAEDRAKFIQEITNQEPRTTISLSPSSPQKESHVVKLTDWSFHHPDDEATQEYSVVFWDLANDGGFEAAQALCFSDATVFVVCVDFGSLVNPTTREVLKTKYQFIRHIITGQPTAHVVFVDTSANLSAAMRLEARSLFQSVYQDIEAEFADALTNNLNSIEEYLRDGPPASAQLRSRITSLKNLPTKPSEQRSWVEAWSPRARDDIVSEVVGSNRGFALLGLQVEAMQALREHKTIARGSQDVDEKISEAFVRDTELFKWVKTQAPAIDVLTFESTLQVLHQLGEVYHFGETSCGPLKGFVCTDVELWLQFVYEVVQAGRDQGIVAAKTLEMIPRWNTVTSANAMHRLKESLAAALIAFPVLRSSKQEPDLVIPTFLQASDDSLAKNPLVLQEAKPQVFEWVRKLVLQVNPPSCLFTQVVVASHNMLREYYQDHEQGPQKSLQWAFDCNCMSCTVDTDFIIRVSVQENQGSEGKRTLTLDAIGVTQHRTSDRIAFHKVSSAIEAVLAEYPGIWVLREDPSWMPQDWAISEQIDDRLRPREALVIDEMLYTDKVCILGPSNWGKTTLVQSLSVNMPRLEHLKRTAGVDLVSSYFLEKDAHNVIARRHVVTFFDCAGEAKYNAIQALFYPHTTLFVICVDLQAYGTALEQARFVCDDDEAVNRKMNRFVKDKVLRLVDKVYFARDDAEIVFVATKADALRRRGPLIDEVRGHLFSQLKTHSEKHTTAVCEHLTALVNAHTSESKGRKSQKRSDESSSAKWLVVSCVTQRSVYEAQKQVEGEIIRSRQRQLLPRSYARALMRIVAKTESLKTLESAKRVETMIWTTDQLSSWLEGVLPADDKSKREDVMSLLHKTGDIVSYSDFKDPKLSTVKKAIVEPQLVVDLACEIFDHKGSSEVINHASLVDAKFFPLWATVNSWPVMLEMKLILRELRIVHQASEKMTATSDLLVPCYWENVITYENIHVGPKYMLFKRSQQSKHEHHVLFKYYLGKVFDDGFFERLALESYSPLEKRVTYNGLIKYTTDPSGVPDEWGPTDREFCQVWVEQEHDDESTYIVCIEAVAATPYINRIWYPFQDVCTAIENVLSAYYPTWPRLLYTVEHPKSEHQGEIKHQVKDVIALLVKRIKPEEIRDDYKWLPPRLDWIIAVLQKRNKTEEVVGAIGA